MQPLPSFFGQTILATLRYFSPDPGIKTFPAGWQLPGPLFNFIAGKNDAGAGNICASCEYFTG